MGIPCAGIVDVDIVKEGGKVWTNLLSSANVPDVTIKSTGISRVYLKSAFEVKDLNFKKNGVLFIGAQLPLKSLHAWIIEDNFQPDRDDRQWINYRPLLALTY